MSEISEFKISDHVDPFFEDWPYWLVDFRRHLSPLVALSKTVTYADNGRPIQATYSYNSIDVAKIRWTFTDFPSSFLMMRRMEEVSYIKNDGTDGDWFIIKDQTYDLNDSSHRTLVLNERVKGRQFVLNDTKGVVMGALQALNPDKTEDEVTEMGGQFWELHNAELSSFIDTGSKNIVAEIGNDTTTLWLQDSISSGVTIAQYMQSRLSF